MGLPFKMKYSGVPALLKTLTPSQEGMIDKMVSEGKTKQANAIKKGIEASPAQSSGKTLSQVKKGEYTNIRDYTPEELAAQVKKTGKSSAQIRREVRNYRKQTKQVRSEAKNVTPNSGTQMGEILAAGGARGEKGIAEEAKRRSAGKSPAKMKGVKGLKK